MNGIARTGNQLSAAWAHLTVAAVAALARWSPYVESEMCGLRDLMTPGSMCIDVGRPQGCTRWLCPAWSDQREWFTASSPCPSLTYRWRGCSIPNGPAISVITRSSSVRSRISGGVFDAGKPSSLAPVWRSGRSVRPG